MKQSKLWLPLAGALIVVFCTRAAEEDPRLADLRRELEEVRARLKSVEAEKPLDRRISDSVSNKYGMENAPVQTKSGRLNIGGLVQVWAYSIQNDPSGWVDIPQVVGDPLGGGALVNDTADNDGFRVRRAEIRLTLDATENIRAFVNIDPAREATGFPSLPDNQATTIPGDAAALIYSPCLCDIPIAPPDSDPRQIHSGAGIAGRLLQDAYIEYHGVVPHHDFRIGQMRRQLGEEGSRDSGQLDFAERAMIVEPADVRDIGAQMHGFWCGGRVNYWFGVYDGAGTAFQQRSNRSDTDDAKDVAATIAVQPLKNMDGWGTLELGYSVLYGETGESGGHLPGTSPVNGSNRRETARVMQYAWAAYKPGGPVRGWWLRGEWGQYRDRFAPSESQTGLSVVSLDPAPFNIEGWYVSSGYRLSESAFCDDLPRWARPLEFAFRYDVMENLFFHDLVSPERRFDSFKTQVYTAGINYYILKNRAKLQLNYNWTLEEDNRDRDDRQLREVRNDSLVVSLQVEF